MPAWLQLMIDSFWPLLSAGLIFTVPLTLITFVLGIVLGLSVNRWRMTPMARPDYPHVAAWYARLAERPGFNEWCDNGVA